MSLMSADLIIMDMAQAMAASHYPYSGAAMVCLPNGTQITRNELWNSLQFEEQENYLNYAYAAYTTIGGIGMERVMMLAMEDYLAEK